MKHWMKTMALMALSCHAGSIYCVESTISDTKNEFSNCCQKYDATVLYYKYNQFEKKINHSMIQCLHEAFRDTPIDMIKKR
jgi:hypothetical protein